MRQLIKNPNYVFTDKINYALTISGILIATSVLLLAVKGLNMGVDFRGGLSVEIKTRTITIRDLRETLKNNNLHPEIQMITKENYILRFKAMEEKLDEKIKSMGFEILKLEYVGPKIGKYIVKRAYYAVVLSLLGILIYIGLRFKSPVWGVAATAALFHDVILSLGFISITSIEFNLVTLASVLTIAGYSINDTIVLFDRIRENIRANPAMKLKQLIDISVNQVLARTMITGISVLFITSTIAILAKEAINDFAYVMLFGILTGTYSSIYIACPLLNLHENKKV